MSLGDLIGTPALLDVLFGITCSPKNKPKWAFSNVPNILCTMLPNGPNTLCDIIYGAFNVTQCPILPKKKDFLPYLLSSLVFFSCAFLINQA